VYLNGLYNRVLSCYFKTADGNESKTTNQHCFGSIHCS